MRGSQFAKEIIGKKQLGCFGILSAMMNASFFFSYLALQKQQQQKWK